MNYQRPLFSMFIFVSISIAAPLPALAANEACAGITEKCTTDKTYDKSIDGRPYSCYDCTQAMCKDGGSGGLAGTKTSSVCTEKATTFEPSWQDDQAQNGVTEMAPKDRPPAKPNDRYRSDANAPAAEAKATIRRASRGANPQGSTGKDSSNTAAITGNVVMEDTNNAGAATGSIASEKAPGMSDGKETRGRVVDHRTGTPPGADNERTNEVVNARRGKAPGNHQTETAAGPVKTAPVPTGLIAPSDLQISGVTKTTLTLSWQDNSTREFGVEVFRIDPMEARRTGDGTYQMLGVFEERVQSRVNTTGRRSDSDDELTPDTHYCYRLRAYSGFDRSEVTELSPAVCTHTDP